MPPLFAQASRGVGRRLPVLCKRKPWGVCKRKETKQSAAFVFQGKCGKVVFAVFRSAKEKIYETDIPARNSPLGRRSAAGERRARRARLGTGGYIPHLPRTRRSLGFAAGGEPLLPLLQLCGVRPSRQSGGGGQSRLRRTVRRALQSALSHPDPRGGASGGPRRSNPCPVRNFGIYPRHPPGGSGSADADGRFAPVSGRGGKDRQDARGRGFRNFPSAPALCGRRRRIRRSKQAPLNFARLSALPHFRRSVGAGI